MKRNLIFLLLAVAVGTAIGLFIYTEHLRSSALRLARTHASKGRWSAALTIAEPINEAHPRNLEAALLAAQAWRGLGEPDKALSALDPFVPPNGREPEAMELAGWLTLDIGQPEAAEALFADLSQDSAWEARALVGSAGAKVAQSGEYTTRLLSEARHQINRALGQDPNLGIAYLVLGEIALIERDLAGASRSAVEAMRLLDNPARAFLLRAKIGLAEGSHKQAEADIQTARQMGAPEIPAQRQLALVRYYDGRIDDAIRLLEEIAASDTPEGTRAAKDLAALYALCGEESKAADTLAPIAPALDTPIARFQRYAYLVASDRFSEADGVLDDLIRRYSYFAPALLEVAARAWAHGDDETARTNILLAHDADPDNLQACIQLGIFALLENNPQQALDYFEGVKDRPGYFPLGALNTSVAYLMLGRAGDAEESLNAKELQRDPRLPRLRTVTLQHLGDLEEALRRFTPSDDTLDRLIYANLLLRSYRFSDAEEHLGEKLRPDEGIYLLLKAAIATARERYSEAGMYLRDLRGLSPPNEDWAALLEAYCLGKNGEHESALQILDRLIGSGRAIDDAARAAAMRLGLAVNEAPTPYAESTGSARWKTPLSTFESAFTLEREGQTEAAMQHYRTLLSQVPSFAPAIDRLAYLLWTQGRPEAARDWYHRLFALGLDTKTLQRNVANLAWQEGNIEAAEELFSQAAAEGDELKIDHILVELRIGKVERAREIVSTLNDPSSPAGRAARGHLAVYEENWTEAERLLGRAADDRPDDPWVRINHGVALVHLSRYPEAEEDFREVVESAPELADGHRLLGQLYADQGLYQEAYVSFSNSLRVNPDQPAVKKLMERIQTWLQRSGV